MSEIIQLPLFDIRKKLPIWMSDINAIFRVFNKQGVVLDFKEPLKRRIYINIKSPILLMAHFDTVLPPEFKKTEPNKIYATGLDDRLGCCIADHLAEHFKTDLLLTDLEETGKTTCKHHKLKKYNWIAEFDRMGKDVVNYDIASKEWNDALEEFWELGMGSYSDIVTLNSKSCCVNIGIGYQLPHSEGSYFDIDVCDKQIFKFTQFYEKYKNKSFAVDKTFKSKKNIVYSGYNYNYLSNKYRRDYRGYKDTYIDDSIMSEYEPDSYCYCDICNKPAKRMFGYNLCENCVEMMFNLLVKTKSKEAEAEIASQQTARSDAEENKEY